MTEPILARVICKVHHRVIGHVKDREGRLVFVHRPYKRNDVMERAMVGAGLWSVDMIEPRALDAPYAMAFLRCSECPKNRMVRGSILVAAARARGRGTRVLV